jgi:hypothetical protein
MQTSLVESSYWSIMPPGCCALLGKIGSGST